MYCSDVCMKKKTRLRPISPAACLLPAVRLPGVRCRSLPAACRCKGGKGLMDRRRYKAFSATEQIETDYFLKYNDLKVLQAVLRTLGEDVRVSDGLAGRRYVDC